MRCIRNRRGDILESMDCRIVLHKGVDGPGVAVGIQLVIVADLRAHRR
jgi:hypothetical protein